MVIVGEKTGRGEEIRRDRLFWFDSRFWSWWWVRGEWGYQPGIAM
jgi:hypothetical protein